MIYALLTAVVVQPVVVGIVLRYVLTHLAAKDQKHAEQIAVLCQRLQAPEQAVIDHAVQQAPVADEPAVNPFLDEDHWEALKRLEGMSVAGS